MTTNIMAVCALTAFSSAPLADTKVPFHDKEAIVSSNSFNAIATISRALVLDEDKRVHLVGCTSAAGTPEFNIALTEKRLQAVKRLLVNDGVNDTQIEVLAMGEECDTSYSISYASEYVDIISKNSDAR